MEFPISNWISSDSAWCLGWYDDISLKKPNWFSHFQLTYRVITAEVITKSIKNAKGMNNTTYAKKLKRKSATKWLKKCERIQKNVCDIPRAPIRKSILSKKWTTFFALYYLIEIKILKLGKSICSNDWLKHHAEEDFSVFLYERSSTGLSSTEMSSTEITSTKMSSTGLSSTEISVPETQCQVRSFGSSLFKSTNCWYPSNRFLYLYWTERFQLLVWAQLDNTK